MARRFLLPLLRWSGLLLIMSSHQLLEADSKFLPPPPSAPPITTHKLALLTVETRKQEMANLTVTTKSASGIFENASLAVIPFQTVTFYNKLSYALVHGYNWSQFELSKAEFRELPWAPRDAHRRHPAWVKVAVLMQRVAHGTAEYVFMLDSDVLMNSFESMDHLLEEMEQKQCVISLSQCFSRGGCNTGYVLVKRSALALEILEAWWHSADEGAEGERYSRGRLWEQTAFHKFIRPKYEHAKNASAPFEYERAICMTKNMFRTASGQNLFSHMSTGRVKDYLKRHKADVNDGQWRAMARSALVSEVAAVVAASSSFIVGQ